MLFLLLALPASVALHLSFILLYKSAVCELQSEEKIKQDRQKDKPAHYVLFVHSNWCKKCNER